MASPEDKSKSCWETQLLAGRRFSATTLEDSTGSWLFNGQLAISATGNIHVGEGGAKWILLYTTDRNVNWLQALGGRRGSNFLNSKRGCDVTQQLHVLVLIQEAERGMN